MRKQPPCHGCKISVKQLADWHKLVGMSMLDWLVARTKPNQERIAADHISQQCQEAYLPKMMERYVKRGQVCQRVAMIFPCYIFVRIIGKSWSWLHSTKGISRVLVFGDHVATIKDETIKAMMSKEHQGVVQLKNYPDKFHNNDSVTIQAGPFAGHLALFANYTRQERCNVLLELLGGKTLIELESAALEHASA